MWLYLLCVYSARSLCLVYQERVRENAEPSRRGFTLNELKAVLERCDKE